MNIIFPIIFISLLELIAIVAYWDNGGREGFNFFNPIDNYRTWRVMNWFGVIFFTLLLNIVLPIWSLCYWFYKLCTIGRK